MHNLKNFISNFCYYSIHFSFSNLGESLFCVTHKAPILSFVKSRVLVFFDEFTAGDMLITSAAGAEFCYVSQRFYWHPFIVSSWAIIKSRIIPDRSELTSCSELIKKCLQAYGGLINAAGMTQLMRQHRNK